MKHIENPLQETKREAMYQMHRYYARKPSNIVRSYIERYTSPNEVVLDSFSGSGVTGIEAIRLRRNAYAIDLNPISSFISQTTADVVKRNELEDAFTRVEEECKDKIEALYATKCPRTGVRVVPTHLIWSSPKGEPEKASIVKVWYNLDGEKVERAPTVEEQEQADRTLERLDGIWVPRTPLSYGDAKFVKAGIFDSVDQLHCPRALVGLGLIHKAINVEIEPALRRCLMLALTASLQQTSRLVIVIGNRGSKGGDKGSSIRSAEVGSWGRPSYWYPEKHFEVNVWNTFENRFKKVLRGKSKSGEALRSTRVQVESNQYIDDTPTLRLYTTSATDLSMLEDESIDYIFNDPPYGGAIQYIELGTLWTAWLGEEVDATQEITINPRQGKGASEFESMIHDAFCEAHRVLKPGRWMHVTFHSKHFDIWSAILRAIVRAGFHLEHVLHQPPLRASFMALYQPYGSAVGDYYIRFQKRDTPSFVPDPLPDGEYERVVIESMSTILEEAGEPIMFQEILNRLFVLIFEAGALLNTTVDPVSVIKKQVGHKFKLIPHEVDGKEVGSLWALK
jgi:adenine-specific DNA methylase